jgi:peptidyl-tRNA hydrolase, PTH1 family
MVLLVGLGNPGAEYAQNRHNIGFMAIEAIRRHFAFAPWRRQFHGIACRGRIGQQDALLLLPGTFMNESGRAVQAAAHFYKLGPADITVFHDEVDLPPGKVRVKTGGTDAGHNGLRSISACIGHEYRRVRLGIGHPGSKDLVHRHVLKDFAKTDWPWVTAVIDAVADNAELLVEGRDASFQNKIHLAMQAKGFSEPKSPPVA